jgi:hypothetical protein
VTYSDSRMNRTASAMSAVRIMSSGLILALEVEAAVAPRVGHDDTLDGLFVGHVAGDVSACRALCGARSGVARS